MVGKLAAAAMLAVVAVGCARNDWPAPPAVDRPQYEKAYQEWRDSQQEAARESTKIVGIWPLAEGDTPFGSDPALPVVLPTTAPTRAGVFRRAGEQISVLPASGVALQTGDGAPVKASAAVEGELSLGSLRMYVIPSEDGRRLLTARDEAHPLLKDLPDVQTYPLGSQWRVAARFDAFDEPRMMKIADVTGGVSEYPAVGRLTFRVGDQEQHLTAMRFADSDAFFIMFKDATNSSTTYGSRMVSPRVVANGEWTVVDFNLARNPPCAYSPYTNCPLPPAENRLAVAIEAGEKRFPTDRGFPQQ
jgi:uncharacterized protein